MTNLLTNFDPFRFFDEIDVDNVLPERFLTLDKNVNRYPLTNLGKDKDNNLVVEVACAGFSQDDLTIETNDNMIVIKGHKEDKGETKAEHYIQQHISSSDFTRKIYMIPLYVGGDIEATYKDGILTLIVHPVESKLPKKIAITSKSPKALKAPKKAKEIEEVEDLGEDQEE
jgi:molecular chaperone IbpA